MDEGFHTGLELTLTGRAVFDSAVDSDFAVTGVWSKTNPFSDLTADGRVRLVGPQMVQSVPEGGVVYESTLTVDTLDRDRGDSGDYTLSLDIISSVPFTAGTSTNTTRSITVEGEVM